ncbi:MAG TPA: VOC family protein [Methanoculleus sp.]|nr:VOC family protein [Methanoculleus sp.]
MPTVVHVDIPAENPDRARTFYERLFHWKFEAPEGYGDYFLSETTDKQGKPGVGLGLGKRGTPDQKITVYFDVDSIADHLSLVERLGGKVVMPRMPVPGYGALAVCIDTESNTFGLWETHADPVD